MSKLRTRGLMPVLNIVTGEFIRLKQVNPAPSRYGNPKHTPQPKSAYVCDYSEETPVLYPPLTKAQKNTKRNKRKAYIESTHILNKCIHHFGLQCAHRPRNKFLAFYGLHKTTFKNKTTLKGSL